MRLPLQLGRGSLNQGARFAAFVWLGPLLLIVAAMFMGTWGAVPAAFGLGLPGVVLIVFSFAATDLAKRDRASDIVLDSDGFVIEGGPLDKTTGKWSEVRKCDIVQGDSRLAVRWLLLSWLTARRVASINARVRVPVKQLQLVRDRYGTHVVAEAEGDEIESLEPLRDSILAAAAPPTEPPPLPQEVLTCPHCDAPLVPAPTPRMTCSYCHHDLDVPIELQQRVRASIELDQNSGSRARTIRKLIDQPSARRAAFTIAWCRHVMVWIQPIALGLAIAFLVRVTSDAAGSDGVFVGRTAPSDDDVGFYDLGLLALVVAAAFAIAWSVGHAYIANRQALRILADSCGAVPPAKPGAPSACRTCNAPLPATTALLVHCAYCATENVLGIDPRPAAMRRKREGFDLARGLRRRRRARIQRWITMPVSALVAIGLVREVRLAWHVPQRYVVPEGWSTTCYGACGTVTNTDGIRRAFAIVAGDKTVPVTVPAHGAVSWQCDHACAIELDGTRVSPTSETHLRIEHGVLKPAP